MLQEWLSEQQMATCRLVVLSENAQSARLGDQVEGLVASAVWGLVRSAQSEEPERLTLVDVDGMGASLDALGAAVASRELQLAIRDGDLLAPRLIRVAKRRGSGTATYGGLENVLSTAGSVLITGGTSGLGSLLARHLAGERGVRSLVLVSRRGPEAEGVEALRAELQALGARVEICACDVSDRAAVQRLLEQVPADFPLRGIVHAAAVLDDGVIESLTETRVERVLAPKVDAAWHLHELTEHLELSMFVLFSSAAATLGSPGQGNYAAANAFLDALAAHRQARGLPGVSMAWGLWAETSELTATLTATDHARMARLGITALSTGEGLNLFDEAIASGESFVIPANLDLQVLRAQAAAGRAPGFLRGGTRTRAKRASDATEASLSDLLARRPPAEHEEIVFELVRTETAVVLGYSSSRAIDGRRAFKALGFDSLAAIELRNRLNAATGLRLPATLAFDYPTPAALAGHLLDQVARDSGIATIPAVGELDRLEKAIGSIDPDSPLRQEIAERLRALLSELDGESSATAPPAIVQGISTASDEEIFAFLDGSSTHSAPGSTKSDGNGGQA